MANQIGIQIGIDASKSTDGAREHKRAIEDIKSSTNDGNRTLKDFANGFSSLAGEVKKSSGESSSAIKELSEGFHLLKDPEVAEALEKNHQAAELLNQSLELLGAGAVLITFEHLVEGAEKLEAAFIRLQVVAGYTGDTMKEAFKEVRGLSDESGAPQLTVLAAQAKAAQAGFESLADSIKATKEGIDLGKLTGTTDYVTTTQTLTGLAQSFQISVEGLSKASAELALASNSTGTSVGQLGSELTRLAPYAKNAGLGLDDLLKTLVLLKDSGENGFRAMTGVITTLRTLGEPTAQVKASFEAASAGLQSLGVNASSLKDLIGQKGLVESFRILKEVSGGNEDIFKGLVGGAQAATAANDLLRLSTEKLTQVDKQFGSAQEDAEAKLKLVEKATEEQAAAVLKGKITNTFTDLVSTFIPAINDALLFINRNFDAFGSVIESVAVILGGKLLIAGGKAALGFVALGKAASEAGAEGIKAAVSGEAAAGALAEAQAPAIEAIGALTAEIRQLIATLGEYISAVEGVAGATQEAVVPNGELAGSIEAVGGASAIAAGEMGVYAEAVGATVAETAAAATANEGLVTSEKVVAGATLATATEITALSLGGRVAVGVTYALSSAMLFLEGALSLISLPLIAVTAAIAGLFYLLNKKPDSQALQDDVKALAEKASAISGTKNTTLKGLETDETVDKVGKKLVEVEEQLKSSKARLANVNEVISFFDNSYSESVKKDLEKNIQKLENTKRILDESKTSLERSLAISDKKSFDEAFGATSNSFVDKGTTGTKEKSEEESIAGLVPETQQGLRSVSSNFTEDKSPVFKDTNTFTTGQTYVEIATEENDKIREQVELLKEKASAAREAEVALATQNGLLKVIEERNAIRDLRDELKLLSKTKGTTGNTEIDEAIKKDPSALAKFRIQGVEKEIADENFFTAPAKRLLGEEGKYDPDIAAIGKYQQALKTLAEDFRVAGGSKARFNEARISAGFDAARGFVDADAKVQTQGATNEFQKAQIKLQADQSKQVLDFNEALQKGNVLESQRVDLLANQAIAQEKLRVANAALTTEDKTLAQANLTEREAELKAKEQNLTPAQSEAFLLPTKIAVNDAKDQGSNKDSEKEQVNKLVDSYVPLIKIAGDYADELYKIDFVQKNLKLRPDLQQELERYKNLITDINQQKFDKELSLPGVDAAKVSAIDEYNTALDRLNATRAITDETTHKSILTDEQYGQGLTEIQQKLEASKAGFSDYSKAIQEYSKDAGGALTRYLQNPAEGLRGLYKNLGDSVKQSAGKLLSETIQKEVYTAGAESQNSGISSFFKQAAAANGIKIGDKTSVELSPAEQAAANAGEHIKSAFDVNGATFNRELAKTFDDAASKFKVLRPDLPAEKTVQDTGTTTTFPNADAPTIASNSTVTNNSVTTNSVASNVTNAMTQATTNLNSTLLESFDKGGKSAAASIAVALKGGDQSAVQGAASSGDIPETVTTNQPSGVTTTFANTVAPPNVAQGVAQTQTQLPVAVGQSFSSVANNSAINGIANNSVSNSSASGSGLVSGYKQGPSYSVSNDTAGGSGSNSSGKFDSSNPASDISLAGSFASAIPGRGGQLLRTATGIASPFAQAYNLFNTPKLFGGGASVNGLSAKDLQTIRDSNPALNSTNAGQNLTIPGEATSQAASQTIGGLGEANTAFTSVGDGAVNAADAASSGFSSLGLSPLLGDVGSSLGDLGATALDGLGAAADGFGAAADAASVAADAVPAVADGSAALADSLPLLGFADGGSVKGSMPIMVGERGPEVFMPTSDGTIIANHNLNQMGADTKSQMQGMIDHTMAFAADGGDFETGDNVYVGERGPELVKFGQPGRVIPNHELEASVTGNVQSQDQRGAPTSPNASPRPMTVHQSFVVQGTPSRQTQDQLAAAAAQGLQRAHVRNN